MGFGFSLVLTAAGAILAWAVNASSSAFNIHAIGYILLAVGIVGLLLSLAFWSTWGGPAYFYRGRRTTVDPSSATRVTEERTHSY